MTRLTTDTAGFGHQFRFVASVLEAKSRPADLGLDGSQVQQRAELAGAYSRVIMQIVVSAAVLAVGLYLLVVGTEPTQKVASGLVGTVMGYWLR